MVNCVQAIEQVPIDSILPFSIRQCVRCGAGGGLFPERSLRSNFLVSWIYSIFRCVYQYIINWPFDCLYLIRITLFEKSLNDEMKHELILRSFEYYLHEFPSSSSHWSSIQDAKYTLNLTYLYCIPSLSPS